MSAATPFWALDPEVTFLNHGSFGACPRPVLAHQQALRERLEAQPVHYMTRELEPALDAARAHLGAFLGADPAGLVFVTNATEGVNTALRAFPLAAGDEILITNHGYGACNNAAAAVAAEVGATVKRVSLPFPVERTEQMVEAFVEAVGPKTRLAIVDHITSVTALVLPIEAIAAALAARGVEVLLDGAHGPGMCPLALDELGVAFYTGNCHKWICAPKGAAFLHTRPDLIDRVRPLSTSHGATIGTLTRSRLHHEFDWQGTYDPSPWLCVPTAIDTMAAQIEGGWPALMARNRALALEARDILCEALGQTPSAPDEMIGSMAVVTLPGHSSPFDRTSIHSADPLHDALVDDHGIEVPILNWPERHDRLVRVSAQLYNTPAHYRSLADALLTLLRGQSLR